MNQSNGLNVALLETYEDKDTLNAIVDTPRGSRNKYKFDEAKLLYVLKGVLPAGSSFPFDFGYLPSTRGEDGDPLDILILMDEPTYTGCLVHSRLIGVVEAEQTEDGKTERNDRLLAVASESRNHCDLKSIDDLSPNLLHEIQHFFVSYNAAKGKQFRILGSAGPERAAQLVQQGIDQFKAGGK